MTFLARLFPHLYKWLPFFEGALVFGSVYAAIALRIGVDPSRIEHHVGAAWPEAMIVVVAVILSLTLFGLYNSRLRVGMMAVVARIFLGFATATLLITLIYYAIPGVVVGRGILSLALVLSFIAVMLLRLQINRTWRRKGWQRRVLVLGAGQRAASLSRLRRRTDLIGLEIVGFVPYPGDDISVDRERLIEVDESLDQWALAHRVVEIVVAPDERRENIDSQTLLACRRNGVTVCHMSVFHERETGQICIDEGVSTWLAFSDSAPGTLLADRVKRGVDLFVSILLTVVTAPIVAVAVLAIRLESGGGEPSFYRQVRVGMNGRLFEMLKLRSMVMDAEADGTARWASRNDPRITRVGRIIRRYRIDELPQIYNVLRGDMSFVGPRPERRELVEPLEAQVPAYADRHRVKPGLTGWAQIRYPYGASEAEAFEKLKYDLYYVTKRSIYLDLVILLQTAEVVLYGKGAR